MQAIEILGYCELCSTQWFNGSITVDAIFYLRSLHTDWVHNFCM